MISILNSRNNVVLNDIRNSIVSSIIEVAGDPAAAEEREDPDRS